MMTRFPRLAALTIAAGLTFPPVVAAESFKTVFPDVYTQLPPHILPGIDVLDLKTGTFVLEGGEAQVAVPEDFYFLAAKDARYVLETLWENLESPTILGMIFPRKYSPFVAESWAITVEFDPMGYMSDKDTASYYYDDLLQSMKDDTNAENEWRVQNGYQKVDLLGWAAEPHCDATARKLYWAKKLHFDSDSVDTLNYNIRELGRKGVLVANFIANADQLGEIEAAVPETPNMVSYTENNAAMPISSRAWIPWPPWALAG